MNASDVSASPQPPSRFAKLEPLDGGIRVLLLTWNDVWAVRAVTRLVQILFLLTPFGLLALVCLVGGRAIGLSRRASFKIANPRCEIDILSDRVLVRHRFNDECREERWDRDAVRDAAIGPSECGMEDIPHDRVFLIASDSRRHELGIQHMSRAELLWLRDILRRELRMPEVPRSSW